MSGEKSMLKIEVVQGVEGKSIYLDDYRIAGNKPWGGGRTIFESAVSKSELLKKCGVKDQQKEIDSLKADIEKLREGLEYYSDDNDWGLDWDLVNRPVALQDRGKIARQILKELGEKYVK